MIKKIVLAGIMVMFAALSSANVMAREVEVLKDHKIDLRGQWNDICDSLDETEKEAAGCNVDTDGKEVSNVVQNIINIVIAVLGIVAVIFIIIGGAQLVISQGDSAKTKKAKETILYAVLGLILAVMAYAIVNFVLANLFKDEGNQGITSESSQDKNGCKEGQYYNAQTGECY